MEMRHGMTYPETEKEKRMAHMPLYLWRMGMGPIVGRMLMVLTTTGRKSGLARHVPVQYVTHKGSIYVFSAFDERGQWYKNAMADPQVTVQTWQGAEAMKASRVTDEEELIEVVQKALEVNPMLCSLYFEPRGIATDPESLREHKDDVYLIRLAPLVNARPMPMQVDLAWIWPIGMLLACLLFVLSLVLRGCDD